MRWRSPQDYRGLNSRGHRHNGHRPLPALEQTAPSRQLLGLESTRIGRERAEEATMSTGSPKRPRTGRPQGEPTHAPKAPTRRRSGSGACSARHGHVRLTLPMPAQWASRRRRLGPYHMQPPHTAAWTRNLFAFYFILASKSRGTHQPVLLAATVVAVQATVQAAAAMRFTRSVPVHRCHPRT